MLDLDKCIAALHNGQSLSSRSVYSLCERVKELFYHESNVLHIGAPVTVVGDIHGQFYDLLELLRIGGNIPAVNYLFLGDFVDRGSHSVETISLLFCLKARYPANVFLLRGNHETQSITTAYGFQNECEAKYHGSLAEWSWFVEAFNFLPLAAVIDNSIFCVHGGLSPLIQAIDQIEMVNRFQEIPSDGAMCDLVWSDPDPSIPGFQRSDRGAGYRFGETIVEHFLHVNRMNTILRAHQLCQNGYEVQLLYSCLLFHHCGSPYRNRPKSYFNCRLYTVWSAPNYCGRCGNLATVYKLDAFLNGKFEPFRAAQPNAPDAHALYLHFYQ
ncbi:putative serine/threonine protein phosphatase [Dimargaris verticillata]|uniref:Serine/threonine-protein phosphatase n=1 Tax=Dimargaris verticillata TaxID=2761393 RepID=A0A9W8B2L3_9FUNG|nr:putative serine/threonine protein phosphatase [Dimargaris verticillata]